MIKKLYSLEHISKIYNTDIENIKIWTTLKFDGKSPTKLPAELNSEIAAFLGVQPKSLKSKKKISNSSSKSSEFINGLKQIKKAKYKERIFEFVTDLKLKYNNSQRIQTIDSIYESLPTKKKYILENCEKKYFTWKDIVFTKNGLKIDPNIIYLSIQIVGPTNILNDINESYFQKKYEKDLYKVYINKFNKKIEHDLSEDIEKIQSIVSKNISIIKNKSSFVPERTNAIKNDFDQPQEISVKDVSRIFQNNKFIQEASKFLNKENKAIALWENNNSILEESILIILSHKIFTFVIWENINDNRACYIFKYSNLNFDKKIKKLKKFINSDIEYKRWDLFNNNGNNNSLNYEEYYTVIHESIDNYKRKLNTHLKPYFSIK